MSFKRLLGGAPWKGGRVWRRTSAWRGQGPWMPYGGPPSGCLVLLVCALALLFIGIGVSFAVVSEAPTFTDWSGTLVEDDHGRLFVAEPY